MEFATSVGESQVWSWHLDLLGAVVVFRSFTLVLGSLDLRLLIRRIQILNNVGVELLDLLLERGETLYLAGVHASGERLGRDFLLDGPLHRWHRHVRDTAVVQSLLEIVTFGGVVNHTTV